MWILFSLVNLIVITILGVIIYKTSNRITLSDVIIYCIGAITIVISGPISFAIMVIFILTIILALILLKFEDIVIKK